MFTAIDKSKNKVSIENANNIETYYCDCCNKPLIIKAKDSLAVRTHFAHKKGSDCDDFSHDNDMSEWHLNWQKQFPLECREVVVSNEKEKHRADVLIEAKKIVIEFQHSPITAEEIARRNKFYLSCGYKVIWVFDAEGQIKNQYDETIDPARCRDVNLCWKREKQQFSKSMDPGVFVFIQYKTITSIRELNDEPIDIMLLLTKIDPKEISFLNTRIENKFYYIFPINFVKDFNDNMTINIPSAFAIINKAIEYKKQVDQQKRRDYEQRITNSFPLMSRRRKPRL